MLDGMKTQTILITGCSTGIGRCLARELGLAGHRVIATARNPQTLRDLPAALRLALDVTNQASIDAALNEATRQLGPLDVLVNNAGFAMRAAVEEIDEDLAKQMFDVNLWGVLRMSKAVLPGMRERRAGRIIHVGSVVGHFTFPVNGAYAASKHALVALTDAMRLELRPYGIAVSLVEPGRIDTNFMATSSPLGAAGKPGADSPYRGLYDEFHRISTETGRQGAGPDRVAAIIRKAVEARRPRVRYLAAVSPLYRVMLAIPPGWRDVLAGRALRIPRGPEK